MPLVVFEVAIYRHLTWRTDWFPPPKNIYKLKLKQGFKNKATRNIATSVKNSINFFQRWSQTCVIKKESVRRTKNSAGMNSSSSRLVVNFLSPWALLSNRSALNWLVLTSGHRIDCRNTCDLCLHNCSKIRNIRTTLNTIFAGNREGWARNILMWSVHDKDHIQRNNLITYRDSHRICLLVSHRFF